MNSCFALNFVSGITRAKLYNRGGHNAACLCCWCGPRKLLVKKLYSGI